jgi:hypothetical protein
MPRKSPIYNLEFLRQASAASKKTELRLTNTARASLEKLRLVYGTRYGAETQPHPHSWEEELIAKYIIKQEMELIGLLRSLCDRW